MSFVLGGLLSGVGKGVADTADTWMKFDMQMDAFSKRLEMEAEAKNAAATKERTRMGEAFTSAESVAKGTYDKDRQAIAKQSAGMDPNAPDLAPEDLDFYAPKSAEPQQRAGILSRAGDELMRRGEVGLANEVEKSIDKYTKADERALDRELREENTRRLERQHQESIATTRRGQDMLAEGRAAASAARSEVRNGLLTRKDVVDARESYKNHFNITDDAGNKKYDDVGHGLYLRIFNAAVSRGVDPVDAADRAMAKVQQARSSGGDQAKAYAALSAELDAALKPKANPDSMPSDKAGDKPTPVDMGYDPSDKAQYRQIIDNLESKMNRDQARAWVEGNMLSAQKRKEVLEKLSRYKD